jgi:hypothetical protein
VGREAPARHGIDWASLPATLAVAGVVLVLYLGPQILNGLMSAPGGQAGQILDAGPFRMMLLPGWQTGTAASGGLNVTKGSVEIELVALSSHADAAALYDSYVDGSLAPGATGFGASDPSSLKVGGVPAARGAYTGVLGGDSGQVEGEITTLVVIDQGYVFDARGPMGTLHGLLAEVEQMISTTELVR